ncbi:hypothetical protein [Luteococcus japonicus]|uniref:Uncharacterized protein n=1 Tax=Luteococcus japonicus LSP_Lj1 TaxID=1255658 RepID=A0A1R4K9B5_9ACTN|nr:hypothetical protein [Luteococcus japonicus]SJN40910.1 hypothetical protein FM114_12345 [Luteococcus japonicus LSP_Lj1]
MPMVLAGLVPVHLRAWHQGNQLGLALVAVLMLAPHRNHIDPIDLWASATGFCPGWPGRSPSVPRAAPPPRSSSTRARSNCPGGRGAPCTVALDDDHRTGRRDLVNA